jgi:hypothetical protein
MRDLTTGLRSRLQRLERRRPPPDDGTPRLPPDFWLVLWRIVPFEDAEPATQTLVMSLCEGSGTARPNPIEEKLRQAAAKYKVPAGLKDLPEPSATHGNGRP